MSVSLSESTKCCAISLAYNQGNQNYCARFWFQRIILSLLHLLAGKKGTTINALTGQYICHENSLLFRLVQTNHRTLEFFSFFLLGIKPYNNIILQNCDKSQPIYLWEFSQNVSWSQTSGKSVRYM